MKNIKKIKINKTAILTIAVFVSFLFINLNVVWFGDDYYYLRYSKMDWGEYFKAHWAHYLADNGRLIVHLLESFFLRYNLIIWQIVNTLILTGIAYFTAKIATFKKKENLFPVMGLSFFLLAFIDITITRQSVYWVVGTFNYAYPILMLCIYWYCLLNLDNKKYWMPAIIFGILSAASVEQCAMMTIGVTLLVLVSKIDSLKNVKLVLKENKKFLILLAITMLCAATVVLAPSQFNRLKIDSEVISGIESLKYNVKFFLMNYTLIENMKAYFILVALIAILYAAKDEDKKRKILMIVLAILNICLFYFNFNRIAEISVTMDVLRILNIGLLMLDSLVLLIYSNLMQRDAWLNTAVIAFVLLVGSQAMMIVSPTLGYRNMLFGLAMINIILCKMFAENPVEWTTKYLWILFAAMALYANINVAKGYAANKKVELINQNIIAENDAILSDKDATIDLYKFAIEEYSWSNPYVSAYHLQEYKDYYEMKCNINWIEFKEIDENNI
ncbi:MAG: hypothetical protein IKJ32_05115 [Clostridia bacterium]|nr:hypothetical protein [Clostridia bacterium]